MILRDKDALQLAELATIVQGAVWTSVGADVTRILINTVSDLSTAAVLAETGKRTQASVEAHTAEDRLRVLARMDGLGGLDPIIANLIFQVGQLHAVLY